MPLAHYIKLFKKLPPTALFQGALAELKNGYKNRRQFFEDQTEQSYIKTLPFNPELGSFFSSFDIELLLPFAEQVSHTAAHFIAHRFDLLGSGWTRVEHGIKCRGLEGHIFAPGEKVHSDKNGKWLKWFNLGDWLPPGELIPDDMVHTFILWYCADITGRTASALGLEDEAQEYRIIADRTKKAFSRRFYNERKGSYGDAGGNILALKMGVPAEQYEKVVAALEAGVLKNDSLDF